MFDILLESNNDTISAGQPFVLVKTILFRKETFHILEMDKLR